MLQSPLDDPQSRFDGEPQSRFAGEPQSRLADELYAMGGSPPDQPHSRRDARRTSREVKVHLNQVAVEGGWSKTKHVVETMTVSHDNGNADELFARVSTAGQWLRSIITDNNERGRMRFLSVLKTCREKLDNLDDDASASTAAVAEGAEDDDVDPMDALADMEPQAKKPKKKPKKTLGGVRSIQMPKSPNADSATVDVRFYMQSAKTKPTLWISVGCLTWLLEYALEETTTLGVKDCDPTGDPYDADAAVAGFRVIWDFGAKRYDAEILKGDHAGQALSMTPSELGAARLAIARRSCDASLTMKDATRVFLEKWCDAVTRNAVDAFEATWSADVVAPSCTTTETESTEPALTDSCTTNTDDATE